MRSPREICCRWERKVAMLEPGTQNSMEQVEVWRREMTWGEPGQIEGYKKWDFEQERSRRRQGKRRKGYASYANMRLFSLFFFSFGGKPPRLRENSRTGYQSGLASLRTLQRWSRWLSQEHFGGEWSICWQLRVSRTLVASPQGPRVSSSRTQTLRDSGDTVTNFE